MISSNHDRNQGDLLETPNPDFTIAQIEAIAADLYGITGDLSPLGSERDRNFRIATEQGEQYMIKIANSADDPAVIEFQTRALEHIYAVDPALPVPRVYLSIHGMSIEHVQAADGRHHLVRLLSYLPGDHPQENPTNPALLRPIGACLAHLAISLRGFFHSVANYELLWDLKQASHLKQYLCHLSDPKRRDLAGQVLDRFDKHVLPIIPKLRAQVVHNDLGPDNMLVAPEDPARIVGIIDFGDMVHTPLINDLANTVTSMICKHTDPVAAAVEIISSYNEITPLEPLELGLLYDLIATRMVMWNVIAHWRVTLHPENKSYIMDGAEDIWETLQIWTRLDPVEVTKRFFRACGFWEKGALYPLPIDSNDALQTHLIRRSQLLGPCAYLSYQRPLHIVRAEGVWMYDSEGNRYLDVYNNVPHVGHCHPHVVKAIASQARRLNTNTRYMHGLILELAARLTQRMPESLSVCMFVCTGTEANELAWRMAKLASKNSGALVTRHAYHGNGDASIMFSPEEVPLNKLPPYVQTFSAPFSNDAFHQPDSGINTAIAALEQAGYRPGMLLLDTAFTSDGIFTAPQGYLNTLFSATRSAGGFCVADEVQAGFGRFGHHFWGFQLDDVVPDIVTMGKPIGNGHPLAAVLTRPEIAAALADDTGYFNTFGGNPVSCAAGLAVLDVIEAEDLQRNALEVGGYLSERFAALQKEYPFIGAAHGAGLLQGLEIVKPNGTPDPDLANRVMNLLRENGVLIGTTGRHYHVLKIRPPMVFQLEHADILLATLTKVLDEL
jgi:4-aminobutyrate aminotransferase-like enzyme/Ser/Thr protein kinase RdoA (MazF antagonist)